MQSPWQTDPRDLKDDHDIRSTSAPPPETSFLFGGSVPSRSNHDSLGLNSVLGNVYHESDERQFGSSYGRAFAQDSSLFTNSNHSSGNRRSPAPPGFGASDLFSSSAVGVSPRNSTLSQDNGERYVPRSRTNDILGSFDRRYIGENLVRSQSAAPSFESSLSMGPPPGLANRETPLASNLTPSSARRASAVEIDSYLESSMSRSDIFQLAQRRPASTGVIGGSQSSSSSILTSLGLGNGSGAVRPAAKTLMDLIQEDFPPESPALEERDFYGNNFQREEGFALERPRTTSPLSSGYKAPQPDQYLYPGQDDGNISGSFNRSNTEAMIEPAFPANASSLQRAAQVTQFTTSIERENMQANGMGAYTPMPSHSHMNRPVTLSAGQHQQHVHYQYDQVNGGYRGQPTQHVRSQIQTQVLPTGHTFYVNTQSPQHYQGYATVQYNPQSQQHQIVNETSSGGMNRQPSEQYISVIPVQGGHIQGIGPGGSYAYWQPPDGNHAGPHTITIIPSGPGGVPVAVASMTNIPMGVSSNPKHKHHNQYRNQNNGSRGKEKSGKARKNAGSTPGRKGGAEGKSHVPKDGQHTVSRLEEFKSKKNNRDWKITDVKGFVVEFCKDQLGSRFVQHRLEVGAEEEKEIVALEVLPVVDKLRNDVFGNYVVQKLFDFGTQKMKDDLRDTLIGEMVSLSTQMYGCRVIQKALEQLSDSDLPKLLAEFHNNVLTLIHDQNGNHVIQKCIEVMCAKAKSADDASKSSFYNDQLEFVLDDVLQNIPSLSCHPYGCRVLQRILEFCEDPRKGLTLDEISKYRRTLLDDQYGNYVIQHVLQFGRTQDRDMVLEMVVENGLLKLSRQKFASNVVEKLLKYGNQEHRKSLVRQMLRLVDEKSGNYVEEGDPGTTIVLLMVRDAYANYVVQTTLDVISDSEEKINLLKELNFHIDELKNYTFAKHILTKISPSKDE